MNRLIAVSLFVLFVAGCKSVTYPEMKGRYLSREMYLKYCQTKGCIQSYYNGVADFCLAIFNTDMLKSMMAQEAEKYSETVENFIWKECNSIVLTWYFEDKFHQNRRGK